MGGRAGSARLGRGAARVRPQLARHRVARYFPSEGDTRYQAATTTVIPVSIHAPGRALRRPFLSPLAKSTSPHAATVITKSGTAATAAIHSVISDIRAPLISARRASANEGGALATAADAPPACLSGFD